MSGCSSTAGAGGGGQGHGVAGDSIVLEEEIDPNYIPTQDEVREYAKWLGMDLDEDRDLFWIAKEGLKAPLPENWKPCKTVDTDEIYYFNFASGESTWDHPCDEYYRKLYEEEKKKKMTSDKAKHDKSKQQAKKDVNQLLGRSRKKKKSRVTSAAENPPHHPSPEPSEVVPHAIPSIFDRKPLPGIGRQPLQGDDILCSLAPSPARLSTVAPPSRSHAHSLVGHRLSQHLSVSAKSEENAHKSDDHPDMGEKKGAKLSTEQGPMARGEDANISRQNSLHTIALQELRTKHGKEISFLERTHEDMKHRLEDTHREQLASHKRQWAADAEAQAQVTRKALDEDLEETRARHARELSRLERDLVDAKAHLAEASRQAEEVRETANVEKYDLESRLAGLKQAVVHQQALLQQAEETTRKVAEPVHSHEECEATLARVLSELKDERKHVAEMECQLKKARNEDARPRPKESDGSQSNTVLLKEKLDTATRENEELSKEVQRLTPLVPEGRHGVGEFTDCREAKEEGEGQAETDLCSLRKALEEADLKLSHFQQLRDGAEQAAQDSAAALMEMQEKANGLELDNNRLVEQVASWRQPTGSDGEVSRKMTEEVIHAEVQEELERLKFEQERYQETLAGMRAASTEHGEQAASQQQEVKDLKAELQASKSETARYSSELESSREREQLLEKDLETTQLAIREGRGRIEELCTRLANKDDKNTLDTAMTENLALENSRLQQELEKALLDRSEAGALEHGRKDDALLHEIQDLRAQATAEMNQRKDLKAELVALKSRVVNSEQALQAERAVFENDNSTQQVQIESLQATIKMLEEEVAEVNRRDDELRPAAKSPGEHLAASKLEVWRAKGEVKTSAAEGSPIIANLTTLKQANTQEDRSEAGLVPAAELERAMAATSEALENARKYGDEKAEIEVRLQRAEEQVTLLQTTLRETSSKLEDARSMTSSVQRTSEHAASQMVGEGELPLASAQQDAMAMLAAARTRYIDAEERLKRLHRDQVLLEVKLRDVTSSQDVQAKELQSTRDQLVALLNGAPHTDVSCQTTVDESTIGLEKALRLSQEKLQLTRSDLAAKEKQAVQLRQEVEMLTSRANAAANDALRSAELASARQKKLERPSKREQMLSAELDEARSATNNVMRDCESAREEVEHAQDHLAAGEKVWRGEKESLLASLQDARKGDHNQERRIPPAAVGSSECKRPTYASVAGHPTRPDPEIMNDVPPTPDESRQPQPLRGDVSDVTSQGLAEELLHQLTKENNLRRESRQQELDRKASRGWKKKLEAERRMLALAKQVVRRQKERVKIRQHHLASCQRRWRDQRRHSGSNPAPSSRRRHPARDRGLDEAKRELDGEVNELNRLVGQLRSSKDWLDSREKKIKDLETLLQSGGSCSESRQGDGASTTLSSHAPSSCESGSVTERLRALEAMQQELDDISDFTADSIPDNGGSHLRMRGVWNGARESRRSGRHGKVQCSPYQLGKENTLPTPQPPFGAGNLSYFAVPGGAGFWPPQAYQYNEEPTRGGQTKAVPTTRFGSRHRHEKACNRDDRFFASRAAVHEFGVAGVSAGSEEELKRWLSRPDTNAGANVLSSAAARGRTDQISKMTVEGRQAQSTVAVHVDWLHTLRQEMALLGCGAPRTSNCRAPPPPFTDVSAAVDALTSPRRVMKAALPAGAQRAQDV